MCKFQSDRRVPAVMCKGRARAAVRRADPGALARAIFVLGLTGVALVAILGWGTIVQALLGGGLR